LKSVANNLLILGTGSGIEKYKDEIKRLSKNKKVEIMTYGLSFMYCVNELGFQPDYHCFIDPVPFLPVYDYLQRNLDSAHIKTKFVLLDPLHIKSSYLEYQSFYGTTPLGRGETPWPGHDSSRVSAGLSWKRFLNATRFVSDSSFLNSVIIPCTSLKHISTNPHLYPEFKDKDLSNKDFHLRFTQDKMILKMQRKPKFNEDKLTSVVLPIAEWLSRDGSLSKNVGIIGFELKGGRYMWNHDRRSRFVNFFKSLGHDGVCNGAPAYEFCRGNNLGLDDAERSSKVYLKLWNEHSDVTKLNLLSLVPPEHSVLSKYIKYEVIENYGKFD
jgi:hypothetical protein